jgi:hypothetical protein
MNLPQDAERRLDVYLRAVERRLSRKDPRERGELIAELRDHALEALRRRAGERPSLADVECVLADMDPPESFADPSPPEPVPVSATAPARGRAAPWLLIALGFLLVNAYGVWKWTHPAVPVQVSGGASTNQPDMSVPAAERIPLSLAAVEQIHLTAAREATLRLTFNGAPNRELLSGYLKLSDEDEAEIAYELAGVAGSNLVLIKIGTLDRDRFTVSLAPGLPPADSRFGPGLPWTGTVAVQATFQFERMEAESPAFGACELGILFNARPDLNGAASFLSVEPPVRYDVEPLPHWWKSGLRLVGDFQPGAAYTVTIKAGLASESGAVIPKDIARTVQAPNRPSAVRLAGEGRYLSPRGKLLIPVSIVNLDAYAVSIEPVLANNLVQLAHRDGESYGYYGRVIEHLTGSGVARTNRIALRPNEEMRAAVNLRDLAGPVPRGVYWMQVSGEKAPGEQRLIVVTDLGLAARAAPGGVLVWVNSLRDAAPVAGAEVVLYGENNQEISRALTDANGLVSLPAKRDDQPFVITARSGDDLSYLDLRRTRVEQGEGLGGAAYLDEGAVEAAVFTERGVYRPGETVFLQALVRDTQMNAPKPFPALFRARRPDGRVFRDIPATLDEYGSAETQIAMPDYLPTGRYSLELVMPGTFTVLGETTVAVEDFVPPQIRVQLNAPAGRLRAGSALEFRVRGEHLFGRAAGGLKAKGYVTFKAAPFTPAAWPGWTFGDVEKTFSPVYRQLGDQVLDAEGRAVFSAETSAAWLPPAAMQVVQQVVVSEASGRTVTSYGSSMIDVYPFYIGLRPAREGSLRVGETQRVSLVEVAPDGSAYAAAKPLVIKLARAQWTSALRRNSSGRYEWTSERQLTVLREDTMAAGGEPADWAFAVDRAGEYVLIASDPASGASTSIRFGAAGPDQEWVEWSRERPDRVELSLDRDQYCPGDLARLLIKAPFSGTALLTVESDRVLDQRVLTLKKNTAEVEIPVRAGYAPNVYCALTLIRPAVAESVWSAHRAVGAIALKVEPPGHRLAVELDVPATNRPRSRLPVALIVRDEKGAPAAGEVTVMAVDEAICMLTAFETPDPLKTFMAQRRLEVVSFDLYQDLMPVIDDVVEGVSHPGGDDAAALRKRLNPIKANRFKPVALWQSNVRLGPDGRASVALDLPEFSGDLRVMAVACNASRAGSAQSSVKVKRNLVVQPSLPRFLAIGDTCLAGIAIFNEGTEPAAIQARVTCGGPLRAETAEHALTLAPGASRSVSVPLVAGRAPGRALCTIEVTDGRDSFRDTIEIAVRPASGLRVDASYRVVPAGSTVDLAAPDGWVPESLAGEVFVSAQPSLKLGRALEYVMQYPYGCFEQTVSGAFPLLFAADLAQRILPQSCSATDLSGYVQAGILRALSMQQGDGSFALWPYQRGTDRAVSLYAAHFLVEANKTSHGVPADRLDAALKWLRDRLDQSVVTEADAENPAWSDDMQERAYACHVLALAGRPDAGWNARLRELAPRLRFASRVHVAAALLLAGEPRQATDLLGRLGLPREETRELGGLLNSDVRDAALLLSAWLDVDPQNEAVSRLAQYLDRRQKDGHWGTTQDNAMALLALGKYAQRVPADASPFAGLLTLPDGSTRALSSTQDVHVALEPGGGGHPSVANRGPGPLHLAARFEGVAREPEKEADSGIAIRRSYLDMLGQRLDPARLSQGDLVIVKLEIDTGNRELDNLAIEELLPAGWEIENPNLATAQQFGWITEKSDWCRHRDIRDDRLLLFTGPVRGRHAFHYAARAVTPGVYVYPPVTAACMYAPEIRSVSGGIDTVEVVP